jgi:acyl-CoA synthetase (AMP-forming)/AMP-acid ligase II
LYSIINAKGQLQATLTCLALHKKAEKIGAMLMDKGKLNTGDHVALIYPPSLDLVAAFYGCLYVGEYEPYFKIGNRCIFIGHLQEWFQ